MSIPKRIIVLLVIIFLASCTESNQSDSTSKEVISSNNTSLTIQNSPREITYLRMKADFSRRVDKGFTIVTLDLKTGRENEHNNDSYKNYALINIPNLHPSEKKVITDVTKINGAPHTIVEIELDSGEVTVAPNIAPRSLLPRYSPDGKKLIFLETPKKNISLSNYRKQNIRKLIELDKDNKDTVVYEKKGITAVEWCSDSKNIIYSLFNSGDLKKMSEFHLLKLGEKPQQSLNHMIRSISI